MWFKNLLVYRLPAGWSPSVAELEEQLSTRMLRPCQAYEMQTRGWVSPSHRERLVHSLNRQHLIALGVNQKLLPASIVNQLAKEKAVEVAAEQGYPVGRRQMREIKERLADELRARALTRRRVTRAWIAPDKGWLIVDSASSAKAEELVETLRDTLGSFAVQLLETVRSPAVSMAAWLMHGDAPGRFNIEQDLELQAGNDTKSQVRYVRHVLDGKEVQKHLSAGKSPTRLGLSWNGRVALVLNAETQIKRLQFLGMDKEQGSAEGAAADEQFDAEFALMTGELEQLLGDLVEALGGEIQAEQRDAA